MDGEQLDILVTFRQRSEACAAMAGMCRQMSFRIIEADYPEIPHSDTHKLEILTYDFAQASELN